MNRNYSYENLGRRQVTEIAQRNKNPLRFLRYLGLPFIAAYLVISLFFSLISLTFIKIFGVKKTKRVKIVKVKQKTIARSKADNLPKITFAALIVCLGLQVFIFINDWHHNLDTALAYPSIVIIDQSLPEDFIACYSLNCITLPHDYLQTYEQRLREVMEGSPSQIFYLNLALLYYYRGNLEQYHAYLDLAQALDPSTNISKNYLFREEISR
ncbi:MAG: hypothetical protein LBG64_04520 [Pseudomonadales bacterium]|jgi:hypothetical protein|nr:hypothetical protein [Pseudomonadales bacterium]